MNYIAEILAFEQWLESHYLPISSQLLWYKLMYLSNKSGWSEWVVVDNLRLMAAVQMGREATFIKARDELIKAGLVEYRRGKKGSPNRYKMCSIKNTFKNEVQNEGKDKNTFKNEVQSVVQSEVQSVTIYKHKQNNIPLISPLVHFEDFWSAFPNKQRRKLTEDAYCNLLLSEIVTEEELVKAAENYAEYVQITGEKMCLPNNFLEKCIFEDFLPGKYQNPKLSEKKSVDLQKMNKFNNFQGRDYQVNKIDDLERKLLECK